MNVPVDEWLYNEAQLMLLQRYFLLAHPQTLLVTQRALQLAWHNQLTACCLGKAGLYQSLSEVACLGNKITRKFLTLFYLVLIPSKSEMYVYICVCVCVCV